MDRHNDTRTTVVLRLALGPGGLHTLRAALKALLRFGLRCVGIEIERTAAQPDPATQEAPHDHRPPRPSPLH